MTRTGLAGLLAVVLAAVAVPSIQASGQSQAGNLGTVRIPKAVSANGQPLAAGTYTVRATGSGADPVVGQSPYATQWVEFVQGGQVKGKELATVLTAAEVKQVVKGASPAPGASRVEMLKGNDFLRVWLNRGGTHYLLHFAVTPTS